MYGTYLFKPLGLGLYMGMLLTQLTYATLAGEAPAELMGPLEECPTALLPVY